MNPRELRSGLATQLERERVSARQMLSLLEEERDALKRQDLATLERVAAAKLAAHDAWEHLARRRNTLLREAGFPADAEGLAACIAGCDEGGRLDALWRALVDLLEDCRRANQANGATIELCRRQVGDTLAALHGHSPPSAALYDARGNTETGHSGRPLGAA